MSELSAAAGIEVKRERIGAALKAGAEHAL